MQAGRPSQTALAAAVHRAAHQVLEGGRIFSDPLALRILGLDAGSISQEAEADPSRRKMRLFIAVRTRFAEDALATSVRRGVRQLVVLGAGLDTFAYRSPFLDRVRVFEVDHPATQEWKRQRLAAAGVPLPGSLAFVPVDFERTTLAEGLAAAGFDRASQTFFTWLGVVPYLPMRPVWSIISYVAHLPGGAHLVFDYSNPPASFSPDRRIAHERRAARVAELGEPWQNYFETADLHSKLTALGFAEIEDLGPPQLAARYFPGRVSSLPEKGGHVLRATTLGTLEPGNES
jgi:methyltransferase (TIGR00027 family)